MLMVVARRGRGRGRGHGRSQDVTERQSHVSLPETVHNGDREEVSLDIDSGEGDSSSDEIGVNSSSVNRKPRGHSSGIYGKPPPLDKIQAVAVGEGHIMDPEATRTVLGIVRQHWHVGCFTYREAELATQGEFQETILKEFRRYYKYEDGISERQGNKHVQTHVKNRMRSIKSDEKRRAFKRAAKNGKPLIDQQPQYFSKEVWFSFCNHFLGEKHASKSEINKKNRMKNVMVHATGSTSHTKIKRDLTLEKNRPPTRLELFERTYKHKSTQIYTSEEARAIAERYKSILDERRQTSNELDEPLEWWIEACGPVKKNRILGEPRISANELLNGSYHENQNPKSPTQSTCGLCLSKNITNY